MKNSSFSKLVTLASACMGTMGASISNRGADGVLYQNLMEISKSYIGDVALSKDLIAKLEAQLCQPGGVCPGAEDLSVGLNALMEIQHNRNLHRQNLLENIPTDSVVDTDGLEYLSALGQRYSDNVLRLARALKKRPSCDDESLYVFRALQAQNTKAEIFDQVLLEMAGMKPTFQSYGDRAKQATEQRLKSVWEWVVEDAEVSLNRGVDGGNVLSRAAPAQDEHGAASQTVVSYSETTISTSF